MQRDNGPGATELSFGGTGYGWVLRALSVLLGELGLVLKGGFWGAGSVESGYFISLKISSEITNRAFKLHNALMTIHFMLWDLMCGWSHEECTKYN